MGLRLSFGFGPLRASVPLTGRRRKRRPARKTFHAKVRLADGSTYKCHHAHRTQQAALECAAKYQRSVNARPKTRPQQPSPRRVPQPQPQVGKPPQWWPRAGWGTIRNYRSQGSGHGTATVSFLFVPDDGSQPQPFELPGSVPVSEMGDFARCILRGDNLTVKVSAAMMADVEQTFRKINQMPLDQRRIMFADRGDLDGDAGWTWTSDYTLVKIAPGLVN